MSSVFLNFTVLTEYNFTKWIKFMNKSFSRRFLNKSKFSIIGASLIALMIQNPVYADSGSSQGQYAAVVQSGNGVAVATLKDGLLQGYISNGIYTYKGVQYATAERFMPPRKVAPWDGVKMAVNYGSVAPQLTDKANDIFPPHWYWPHWEARNLAQGEDCQNLNIWTPALNDNKKRPVMVWLHGGGFFMGSASAEDVYDGENLSRRGNVVVVSVNHRLNSLGFLDLSAYGDKYRDSGNAGMLDIVAALEWIHENIEKFGGDPDNVTVFGQSGGGSKVATLMAMPKAKGLFHKAIIQSGAIELMGMSVPRQESIRKVAAQTLKNLKLSAKNVDKLATLSYDQLSSAANAAFAQVSQELGPQVLYPNVGWGPVLDGRNVIQDPVLGGVSEMSRQIPVLNGTVANEWTTIDQWPNMAVAQYDNKNNWSDEEVAKRLQAKYGKDTDRVVEAFKKAYPDKPVANALYVDTWMRTRALKVANTISKQPGAPVYNYVFTWETPVMGGFGMAYHCSEIPFVFNNINLSAQATGTSKEAYKLAETISDVWVSFARDGKPSSANLPEWKPFTQEHGYTMVLDNKSELRDNHDKELMSILMPDYNFQ